MSESENPLLSNDTRKRLTPNYNLLSSNLLNLKDNNKIMITNITKVIIENSPSEIEDIVPQAYTLISHPDLFLGEF